jgi:hypothetical protein
MGDGERLDSFNTVFGNDFNMWEEAKARALKHKEEVPESQNDTKVEASGRPLTTDGIPLTSERLHRCDQECDVREFHITKSRCSENEHVCYLFCG